MKYKSMIILVLTVFVLITIAGVSAAEANDTAIASEDTGEIELSASDDISVNNLETNENNTLAQANNEETVSTQTDSEILTDDQYTYSDLREQIGTGGNTNLTKGIYTYNNDDGDTIVITTSGVINGNGAVIDMNGFNLRAFYVSVSGVTFKNLTIKNANYAGSGGAVYFYRNGETINCNFTNNTASDGFGGAVYFWSNGEVTNCNFTNNSARYGGAIRFNSEGNVTNCNFVDNKATSYDGGAIYFSSSGTVENCNFVNNNATDNGGAIWISSGNVTNCNFTNNSARYGGAIEFEGTGTVTNCNFADNSANRGGAIFSNQWYTTADTCIFKANSGENVNVVIFAPTLNVDNFTTFYGSGEKLTFDLKTNSSIPITNGNISISVYFKNNDSWVGSYNCLSGEEWTVDLPVGSYYAIFDTEYAEFKPINRTITITIPAIQYYANVTSLTTNNKTVNITAESNIPENLFWNGKLLFIVPNSNPINATYAGNGTWWAVYTFDDYATYEVNATYVGLDNVTITNATITVNKPDSTLTVGDVVFDYGSSGSTSVSFANASGVNASIIGQPKAVVIVKNNTITVSGLDAGTYTLSVTTIADADHNNITKTSTITVNKLNTALTAGAKTFKFEDKTKKYAVTLKDSKGNAIKNAKVTLKVNGVTYTATTNSNGVATFTLNKLTKTGNAVITYPGDKNHNKATKKIKLTVKAPAFKTVSYGSKDKTMVKKIQKALKKNGFYIQEKGRYLKIDGIFHKYTVKAVKQFQKANKLKVTGKVDYKTAKKLKIVK